MFKLIETYEHAVLNFDNLEEFQAYRNKDSMFVEQGSWKAQEHKCKLTYYIGLDWIIPNETALYVAPKLDKNSSKTNYLKMLQDSLTSTETIAFADNLYQIHFDEPLIEIDKDQDLLTPLLLIQYLKSLESIVKKGLKKSYYRVKKDLKSRVKGKILIGAHIKRNILKNRFLNTACAYEEFGVNSPENKLLKKALVFTQNYLNGIHTGVDDIQNVFNYILPSFTQVKDDISMSAVKQSKFNAFYKEYEQGIKLAKLILKRFGYNFQQTQNTKVQLPPFRIDMTKLFELYVLKQLRDEYGREVVFQVKGNYGICDYLFLDQQVVVDAKYKPTYQCKSYFDPDNIRQLSGYARDTKIREKLGVTENQVIKSLIIYPDQSVSECLFDNDELEIFQFIDFYKRAVKLPEIDE